MIQKLFLLTVFAFISANASAQEEKVAARQPNTIITVEQFIASLRAGNSPGHPDNLERLRVEELLMDLQPSVYFYSGEVKSFGDSPVCLFTDINGLKTVTAQPSFKILARDIEMLIIKINNAEELNSVIDLSSLSNFPKLKYIYIRANDEMKSERIIRMIRNDNPKYNVFYNIEKAS